MGHSRTPTQNTAGDGFPADPIDGSARLSRAAAPSAIPAAAEQAGGRAECLCIASARVLARFCR